MTLTLVHSPRSRSSAFLWLLEELGAPYQLKLVTIRRGDGSGQIDAANPHPHAKVPVLLHDGALVHEQTAIALYLTDLFPANGIGPLLGDPKRGPYLSWLAYYSGVVEPAFLCKLFGYAVPRGSAGWVDLDEVMVHIGRTLEKNDYLLGERFSAVDLLFGGTFHLFWQNPVLPKTPVLEAYVKRVTARPALARAQAKDGG